MLLKFTSQWLISDTIVCEWNLESLGVFSLRSSIQNNEGQESLKVQLTRPFCRSLGSPHFIGKLIEWRSSPALENVLVTAAAGQLPQLPGGDTIVRGRGPLCLLTSVSYSYLSPPLCFSQGPSASEEHVLQSDMVTEEYFTELDDY